MAEGTQEPPQSLKEQIFIGKTVENLLQNQGRSEAKGFVYSSVSQPL